MLHQNVIKLLMQYLVYFEFDTFSLKQEGGGIFKCIDLSIIAEENFRRKLQIQIQKFQKQNKSFPKLALILKVMVFVLSLSSTLLK